MKQILAGAFVAIVTASPALAGVCNGVGGFTHCSGDDGSQTNIQRNGDYYQVQRQGKDGKVTTEGFWNYNHDDDSGDR
jgi:hypothetical protein